MFPAFYTINDELVKVGRYDDDHHWVIPFAHDDCPRAAKVIISLFVCWDLFTTEGWINYLKYYESYQGKKYDMSKFWMWKSNDFADETCDKSNDELNIDEMKLYPYMKLYGYGSCGHHMIGSEDNLRSRI